MFCCPNCSCTTVQETDLLVTIYDVDQDTGELTKKQQENLGNDVGFKCNECDEPFNLRTWNANYDPDAKDEWTDKR